MKISIKQINNLDNILQSIKDRSSAPISINTTLLASAWADNKITISNANIKATSLCILSAPSGTTEDVFTELADASLVCSEQVQGKLTIKALGKVPEHDIVINIVVFQTVEG